MFLTSDFTPAARDAFCWFKKIGIAIAANTPIITMTTISSMREKPSSLVFSLMRFVRVFILSIRIGRNEEVRGWSAGWLTLSGLVICSGSLFLLCVLILFLFFNLLNGWGEFFANAVC